MKNRLFCALVLTGGIFGQAWGEQERAIPVYPGAQLEISQDTGAGCCDFVTTAPFAKVEGFYEKALKTKPLVPNALATAYPILKQQMQMMEGQVPPSFKIREFVLGEIVANNQKMPLLFELTGDGRKVHFSIDQDALTGGDARFARQWRAQTGNLTEEDKQQAAVDQAQAEDAAEQKERDARRAKEEPEFRQAMSTELVKFLKHSKIALPAGLQCENIQSDSAESGPVYEFFYTSPGGFKKAYDFFAARNGSVPIGNGGGLLAGISKYESVNYWREAHFNLKAAVITVVEVSLTKDGPKETYVNISVTSGKVVNRLEAIRSDYESRW